MAARDFTLTITAVAQPLSSVLSPTTRGGTVDEAYRQIILSTETDCFIGSSSSLTTTAYGYKLLAPSTSGNDTLVIGPFETGPVKLSDVWVIGTSGKLHILGIPF
jgi:hypothetical protein